MANTPRTHQAAESALATHVGIVDLIADLPLLVDDERAGLVAERAAMHASEDRSGV